jgi:formylglycine-generating enzyme required for sulfatase activity
VGNAAYKDSPLRNPVNDARAMRDKLKGMGFEVAYFENLQTKQVGSAMREFRNLIRPGSVALFFYAGHGLQVRGENYLPTVDAELAGEEDVPNQSLSLSLVLNTMEDSKAGVNLVLLDACRNNPYARNFRSGPTGLARVQAPSGTLIHYATRPGAVAEDGTGKHGTYTEALLRQIDEKGVPIETALKRVTIRVRDATKGKQEPWMEGSLTGDFYFIATGNAQITVQQAPANADAAAWAAAESINTMAAYQAYLVEYPTGLYAAAARIKLASLRAPALAAPATPVQTPAAAPAPATTVAATVAPAVAAAPVVLSDLLSPVPADTKDPDAFVWRDVQARGGKEHFEAYVQHYPRGRFVALARAAIKRLELREVQLRAEQRARVEPQFWETARQTNTPEAYQAYLQEYPAGRFVAMAQAALKTLQQATNTATRPVVARPVAADKEPLRLAALQALNLTRVTGAEYQMGADFDELGEGSLVDEAAQPQHTVKVGNFELGTQEVTVLQFRKFVEATGHMTEAEGPQPGCMVPSKGGQWVAQPTANWRSPGHAQTDSHPVVCVSWNDAQAYLAWLGGAAERLRLPSESEWEFAARAGTTTPRPWSDTAGFFSRTWNTVKPWAADRSSRACRHANVGDEALAQKLEWPDAFTCSDGYVHPVPGGYFSRNNFGLVDMMGNVAEWTQDCWNPNHTGAPRDAKPRISGDCTRHVIRGGSWASSQASIRSAARHAQPRSYRAADLGFRLARSAKE